MYRILRPKPSRHRSLHPCNLRRRCLRAKNQDNIVCTGNHSILDSNLVFFVAVVSTALSALHSVLASVALVLIWLAADFVLTFSRSRGPLSSLFRWYVRGLLPLYAGVSDDGGDAKPGGSSLGRNDNPVVEEDVDVAIKRELEAKRTAAQERQMKGLRKRKKNKLTRHSRGSGDRKQTSLDHESFRTLMPKLSSRSVQHCLSPNLTAPQRQLSRDNGMKP